MQTHNRSDFEAGNDGRPNRAGLQKSHGSAAVPLNSQAIEVIWWRETADAGAKIHASVKILATREL